MRHLPHQTLPKHPELREQVLQFILNSGHFIVTEDGHLLTNKVRSRGRRVNILTAPVRPDGAFEAIREASYKGYRKAEFQIDGKKVGLYMQEIVFVKFHGPVPTGCTINHKNHVRSDNRKDNLEPQTPKQQCEGTAPKNKRSKEVIAKIIQEYRDGKSTKQLAQEYGYGCDSRISALTRTHIPADERQALRKAHHAAAIAKRQK